MSETISEHDVSLNAIDPRALFALNPATRLVTPDLFVTHWSHARFSVANTGKLLANMLAGHEGLLSGNTPDIHYLGTQRAMQQVARRESAWPTPELNDEDTAILAANGITAKLFPTIIYRFTTWQEHYGKAKNLLAPSNNIAECNVLDSPPKIYEMDLGSCFTLSRLWDIELSDDAYDIRQRAHPAHLPRRGVPRITRQKLAEMRRQARTAEQSNQPPGHRQRHPRAVQPIRQQRVQ